jgi:hypothetical protein
MQIDDWETNVHRTMGPEPDESADYRVGSLVDYTVSSIFPPKLGGKAAAGS